MFSHDLFDDLGHGLDIGERIQRDRFVQGGEIAFRSAAVLRWSGPSAAGAARIGLVRLRRDVILNSDFVMPRDAQVVFVGEPVLLHRWSVASVTSGEDADSSHEP